MTVDRSKPSNDIALETRLGVILRAGVFVGTLADAGFRVVTFDNRDVGWSHKFEGVDPNLGPILTRSLELAAGIVAALVFHRKL